MHTRSDQYVDASTGTLATGSLLVALLAPLAGATAAAADTAPAPTPRDTSSHVVEIVRLSGDGPAAREQQELTVPDWMQVNEAKSTVSMEIVAGKTDANNNWNFNGYYAGNNARIVVPQGYEITIDFVNQTGNLVAHSLGIDETMESWPATFQNPKPVFEGAITSNPTSMKGATRPGESETITFTASEAGKYAMVCYIPGHATAGMWIYFTVSGEGEAGFTELE